jgi:hypothetical protein
VTYCFLGVEDRLSEAVGRRLIGHCLGDNIETKTLMKDGQGYLFSNLRSKFFTLATHNFVLVITDLDRKVCAPALIAEWMPKSNKPEKLLFRVAVREIESWILADIDGFAQFLGIGVANMPREVESIDDPKRKLIDLARKSKNRQLREELLPSKSSKAKQGLGYNDLLVPFVQSNWNVEAAQQNSNSLNRAIAEIERVFSA